ncbi:MAG: agmatinase family protein [Flavobacterium sp.]|nr:agmatinase family protein [Flavobacterium sp.]
MTKQQIIDSFDPSQPGLADGNIFGLPFTADQSEVVVIPVPWEVTVSYGAGASQGPDAILNASFQVDLHHQEYPELWKQGIYLDTNVVTDEWLTEGQRLKEMAQPIIKALENGEIVGSGHPLDNDRNYINAMCRKLHDAVKQQTLHWISKDKKVALLGGDHSTPLGYYEALAETYGEFGILHLDAHMDLRIAYEGFTYSHASIMYNALKLPQITKIVSVGIRDFCKEEVDVVQEHAGRVVVNTDADLKAQTFEGKTWKQQCDRFIDALPEKVVVSFDIDGLYPWYCPNTGTPVPGGISFEEAAYLISKLADSNKKIIGFDLVEVAPGDDDWDGNVGARMLYHMCGALAKNSGLHTGNKLRF